MGPYLLQQSNLEPGRISGAILAPTPMDPTLAWFVGVGAGSTTDATLRNNRDVLVPKTHSGEADMPGTEVGAEIQQKRSVRRANEGWSRERLRAWRNKSGMRSRAPASPQRAGAQPRSPDSSQMPRLTALRRSTPTCRKAGSAWLWNRAAPEPELVDIISGLKTAPALVAMFDVL